jgi:hypothetical protein
VVTNAGVYDAGVLVVAWEPIRLQGDTQREPSDCTNRRLLQPNGESAQ